MSRSTRRGIRLQSPPYSEISIELDGAVGVQRIDPETGYCDCCDKKTIITWHIETFNGGGLNACEDCGRKVLYMLRERST